MPTYDEFVAGLSYVDRQPFDARLCDDGNVTPEEWAVMSSNRHGKWSAEWTEFTGDHWEIPAGAIALYLLMIIFGPMLMANRCAAHSARATPARLGGAMRCPPPVLLTRSRELHANRRRAGSRCP